MSPASELSSAEIQRRFPELEVFELIGRGGMGLVFRARQTKLDRQVALKILAPELANEPAFEERFAREARALARLAHPHIVGVHDFGERDGLYYLLLEYVEGTGLRDAIAAGTLSPVEALAIVPQICAGLQYAHEKGVVHRDIKPENILLDLQGRVKIADFGLAKMLADGTSAPNLTRTSQVMGTPQYMAPEQMDRPLQVDHRADIYSLGVVVYEMLTGDLPVGRFPPPSEKVRVDVRLDEVVLRTLEREPERRYQEVRQFNTDVEVIKSGPPPPGGQGSAGAGAGVGTLSEGDGAQGPDTPQLGWIDRMPGGPLVLGGAAIAVAWLWLAFTRSGVASDRYAWISGAYPFAFLAFLATGTRAAKASASAFRPALRWAALLTGVVALTLVSLGGHEDEWGSVLLAATATGMAHLVFDQWVRSGAWPPLVGAVIVQLVGTAMHASLWYVPGRGILYYTSGMVALYAMASLVVRLPDLTLPSVPRSSGLAFLRAGSFAVIAAAIYFHEFIF